MKLRYLTITGLIILSLIVGLIFNSKTQAEQAAMVNKPAPDFSLKDAFGNQVKLSDFKNKIIVLEWVNFGCPFVRKHYGSNNMQSLQSEFTKKGVVWLSICSSAPGKQGNYSLSELPKAIKANNNHATAYLVDENGSVGKLYGAKTTPHMFVVDKSGTLVYAGAIDDTPGVDQAEIKTAHNYVREALELLLSGQKVKQQQTKSYGCSVKYAD